jgi:phosphatidylglycerol:prolipoprotein diacylglycerol transferase
MLKLERINSSEAGVYKLRRRIGINYAIKANGAGTVSQTLNLTGLPFIPRPRIEIIADKYYIASYRLAAFAATAVSAIVMKFSARREGINEAHALQAYLWGILGGGLGALAMYHLETRGLDKQNLIEGLTSMARPGQIPFFGYSWFGGLTGGSLTMLFVAKLKKIPLGKFLDAMAPAGLVFHALARIGCFISGDECFGTPTDLPWGTAVHGAVRHPAPLYHTVSDLLTAALVWRLSKNKKFTGQSFLLGLSLHTLSRFFIEFVRVNAHILGTGLSLYQFISLGLFSLATSLLVYLGIKARSGHG